MTRINEALEGRSVVLIGLMGAGKTAVGRRLAGRLDLAFTDADNEIEAAAGCSIPDIFALYGEAAFRDGERKVITRLMSEGPRVLATGGGAYMDPETRAAIADKGIAVWLRADVDLLARRTAGKRHRPLLEVEDPRARLESLMAERYPVYGRADVIVDARDEPVERTVDRVLDELARHLGVEGDS